MKKIMTICLATAAMLVLGTLMLGRRMQDRQDPAPEQGLGPQPAYGMMDRETLATILHF